jgi:hypothetical protein
VANDPSVKVLASALQGSETRVVASSRSLPSWNGGRLVWLRGCVSGKAGGGGHHLEPIDPALNFNCERLPGLLLSEFGWQIRFEKRSWAARCPITLLARRENGFFLSGFTPDTTSGLLLKTPLGAPLPTGSECVLRAGFSSFRMPKSWHKECRLFIVQDSGFVSAAEVTAEEVFFDRQIRVSGLKGATVRYLYEAGKEEKTKFLLNPQHPFLGGDWLEPKLVSDATADYFELRDVSGDLMVQTWNERQ